MSNINRIFHRVLLVVTILSVVALSPEIIYSQEVKAIGKPVLGFAQKALEGYSKKVINKKNFAKFGFKSFKEAQVARVGDPYRVMFFGLKNLRTYEPGTGVKPLLIDPNTLWFPVVVEGKTRTRLEVIQRDGKLIAGAFGGIRTVKKVTGVKNQLPKLLKSKKIKKTKQPMLIKIPPLYAMFLYIESPKGEFLIPTMIQPQRYKLKNGQMYIADEVLTKLREVARKIDPKKVM